MICTPQLPFHKEGEKIRLVGPVLLSCGCGGVIARFATLQQNLAARIPQAKPKSNRMVNDWLTQEGLKEKFPILTKHQYGLVVAETENGFEGVNIMGGATMNVVNQIADLIRRSNEYRRSNKTA